jgi:hypothetical protein
MSSKGKYLIMAALGCSALAVFATAVVRQHRDRAGSVAQTAIMTDSPAASPDDGQKSQVNSAQSSANVAAIDPIPPLPANATSIPDEDLLKLSAMVDLADAATHRPDKERWKQAISISQKLMEGPCDCEQRNWLTRFVEMGNFALSDSESEYRGYATMMATMGRNDNQAMAMSKKPQ